MTHLKKYFIIFLIPVSIVLTLSCLSRTVKPKPDNSNWIMCPVCSGYGTVKVRVLEDRIEGRDKKSDECLGSCLGIFASSTDAYYKYDSNIQDQKREGIYQDPYRKPDYDTRSYVTKYVKCNFCNGTGWLLNNQMNNFQNNNLKNESNISNEEKNKRLLIEASKDGKIEVVKSLIDTGVDINTTNSNGFTSLILASERCHTEIIELLVKAGADVNLKDGRYGSTALIFATYHDCEEIVKLLIKAKSDTNIVNEDGNSALIMASKYKFTNIVKILINAGANVNAKDAQNGNTALIYASDNSFEENVKLLIKEKSDINLVNKDGNSALMVASTNGFIEIVKILLNSKADINIKNDDGKTALSLAYENRHNEIINLLKTKGAK
jgi:ankyrin repeat protein